MFHTPFDAKLNFILEIMFWGRTSKKSNLGNTGNFSGPDN